MTKLGYITPMQTTESCTPGLVAVIAYDGLCTFEFGIAVEVFGLPRPEFDFPWYDFEVVAAEGKRSRALGGIVVEASANLARLRDAQTIIIPGWRDKHERPPQKLLSALIEAEQRGARFLSICSGVFVLAATGLLKNKRATTHWRHMPELKTLYPDIRIEEDVLYVDEGNIITSSGSAAGIDACLHLVRRDFGPKIANSVARRLVMAPHRDGGQAQYVAAPLQERPGRTIGAVMDWARAHLVEPLDISAMAKHAAMSERTFLRRFQDSTGLAPASWLQRERVFRAQELLEATSLSLDEIASQCGYISLETFRVAFKRVTGLPPAAFRARFQK
jgi:AraC family transcriptional regulator, transcriptional activator FtrA